MAETTGCPETDEPMSVLDGASQDSPRQNRNTLILVVDLDVGRPTPAAPIRQSHEPLHSTGTLTVEDTPAVTRTRTNPRASSLNGPVSGAAVANA